MPTFSVTAMVEDQPCFEVTLDEILGHLELGGAVRTLSPLEYHTHRQRKWYKGVCIPDLVKNDENGETAYWWDTEVKKKCNGLEYLKKEFFPLEDGEFLGRLTIKGVGKKKMGMFITEILSKSLSEGWNIAPPDPDLREELKARRPK